VGLQGELDGFAMELRPRSATWLRHLYWTQTPGRLQEIEP
jgi:hypothetical protein